jgi:hypothetical protein
MINDEFQKLNTTKAPGPDGINNKILKKAKQAIRILTGTQHNGRSH